MNSTVVIIHLSGPLLTPIYLSIVFQVRWIRVVYADFEAFSEDAELLVSRRITESFDYVEGFAFVNSDDPVNGWDSVGLVPGQRVDPNRIPSGAGPLLYCLEVALHYRKHDSSKTVDKVH